MLLSWTQFAESADCGNYSERDIHTINRGFSPVRIDYSVNGGCKKYSRYVVYSREQLYLH